MDVKQELCKLYKKKSVSLFDILLLPFVIIENCGWISNVFDALMVSVIVLCIDYICIHGINNFATAFMEILYTPFGFVYICAVVTFGILVWFGNKITVVSCPLLKKQVV